MEEATAGLRFEREKRAKTSSGTEKKSIPRAQV